MDQSSWIAVDDILTQIAGAFSTRIDRNSLGDTNRQMRALMPSARAEAERTYARRWGERPVGLIRGAMIRYHLTKFPAVTSMGQSIREIVPPFWILATAMSTHADALGRREHAAGHIGRRFSNEGMVDMAIDTPELRRIQAEAYVYAQYADSPDTTLGEYLQSIADKCGREINVEQINDTYNADRNATAPELLIRAFSEQDLATYGY